VRNDVRNDLRTAILQLTNEKGLAKETVINAIESALTSTYKRTFGQVPEVHVRLNEQTGEFKVYAEKHVVINVEDPRTQISLKDVEHFPTHPRIGETVEVEVEHAPKEFGRIAAQTAKQVILQRFSEAERDRVFDEVSRHQDDIVSGVVQRVEPKGVIVSIQELGDAEAVLPPTEQAPGEHYRVGQRLKVYVVEAHKSVRGMQITVSRTHRNLVKRLFELEVPEIRSGAVEIKALAREPGVRTKVAVAARQENVDPVGSCVGQRGVRIQNVVNELGGEKIDVMAWSNDPAAFIAAALRPANVVHVSVHDGEKKATVVVPDKELSLAIGKEGQNARLAARLTGWHIDIKKASEAARPTSGSRAAGAAAVGPKTP
jgi:N utilization substance protein A